MTVPLDASLIDHLTTIVSRAAAAILAVRERALDTRIKADQSPVTAADDASEAIILEGVGRLLPGVPIISEEASAGAAIGSVGNEFILVDPVDGTRELVAGRDEFTINVGLVRAGSPVLGVVAAPALGLVWRTAPGGGAERFRLAPGAAADAATELAVIRTRAMPKAGIVAAVSRSHFDPASEAFLTRLGDVTRMASGSAIKLCRVAEGAADIYPRLAPTHQWDVAAGHAVLAAAGGTVTTPERLPLAYRPGADGLRVPGFIAWGDPSAVNSWVLGRERMLDRGPGFVRRSHRPLAVHSKYRFAFRRLEQIEPLAGDHPDARVARRRHAAADPDRIVAAEPRHIDLRVGGEGAEIAGIAKSPDHPGMPVLEFALPECRRAVGEIGHGVEAVDGQPAVAVDHDVLGGRGRDRQRRREHPQQGEGRNCSAGAPKSYLPWVPPCGHSIADPVAIRLRSCRKPRLLASRSRKSVTAMELPMGAVLRATLLLVLLSFGTPLAAQEGQPPPGSQYPPGELVSTGHRFFGTVSRGLASVIEKAVSQWGQPNGYILGQEAGGAFVAGLRYGEGTLYTRNAGDRRVFWQGPSIGFDWGGEGARTMILVYQLPSTDAIYQRFAGIDGSAYFVGGFGMTALGAGNIVLVPIRSGVGLRLGANIGYLHFTRAPTWNPF